MTEQREQWITIDEASELTERSTRTLRRWVAAGLVKQWQPRRITYLLRADVLAAEKAFNEKAKRLEAVKQHAAAD